MEALSCRRWRELDAYFARPAGPPQAWILSPRPASRKQPCALRSPVPLQWQPTCSSSSSRPVPPTNHQHYHQHSGSHSQRWDAPLMTTSTHSSATAGASKRRGGEGAGAAAVTAALRLRGGAVSSGMPSKAASPTSTQHSDSTSLSEVKKHSSSTRTHSPTSTHPPTLTRFARPSPGHSQQTRSRGETSNSRSVSTACALRAPGALGPHALHSSHVGRRSAEHQAPPKQATMNPSSPDPCALTAEISSAATLTQLCVCARMHYGSLNAIHVSALLVQVVRLCKRAVYGRKKKREERGKGVVPVGGAEKRQRHSSLQSSHHHHNKQQQQQQRQQQQQEGGAAWEELRTHTPHAGIGGREEEAALAELVELAVQLLLHGSSSSVQPGDAGSSVSVPLLWSCRPRELSNIAWALVKLQAWLPATTTAASTTTNTMNAANQPPTSHSESATPAPAQQHLTGSITINAAAVNGATATNSESTHTGNQMGQPHSLLAPPILAHHFARAILAASTQRADARSHGVSAGVAGSGGVVMPRRGSSVLHRAAPQALANLLWAFAHWGLQGLSPNNTISASQHGRSTLNSSSSAHPGGAEHQDVCERAFEALCSAFLRQLPYAQPQEVAMVAWSLGKLQRVPHSCALLPSLIQSATSTMAHQTPLGLANTLWGVSKLVWRGRAGSVPKSVASVGGSAKIGHSSSAKISHSSSGSSSSRRKVGVQESSLSGLGGMSRSSGADDAAGWGVVASQGASVQVGHALGENTEGSMGGSGGGAPEGDDGLGLDLVMDDLSLEDFEEWWEGEEDEGGDVKGERAALVVRGSPSSSHHQRSASQQQQEALRWCFVGLGGQIEEVDLDFLLKAAEERTLGVLPWLASSPQEAASVMAAMVKLGGARGPRLWRELQKQVSRQRPAFWPPHALCTLLWAYASANRPCPDLLAAVEAGVCHSSSTTTSTTNTGPTSSSNKRSSNSTTNTSSPMSSSSSSESSKSDHAPTTTALKTTASTGAPTPPATTTTGTHTGPMSSSNIHRSMSSTPGPHATTSSSTAFASTSTPALNTALPPLLAACNDQDLALLAWSLGRLHDNQKDNTARTGSSAAAPVGGGSKRYSSANSIDRSTNSSASSSAHSDGRRSLNDSTRSSTISPTSSSSAHAGGSIDRSTNSSTSSSAHSDGRRSVNGSATNSSAHAGGLLLAALFRCMLGRHHASSRMPLKQASLGLWAATKAWLQHSSNSSSSTAQALHTAALDLAHICSCSLESAPHSQWGPPHTLVLVLWCSGELGYKHAGLWARVAGGGHTHTLHGMPPSQQATVCASAAKLGVRNPRLFGTVVANVLGTHDPRTSSAAATNHHQAAVPTNTSSSARNHSSSSSTSTSTSTSPRGNTVPVTPTARTTLPHNTAAATPTPTPTPATRTSPPHPTLLASVATTPTTKTNTTPTTRTTLPHPTLLTSLITSYCTVALPLPHSLLSATRTALSAPSAPSRLPPHALHTLLCAHARPAALPQKRAKKCARTPLHARTLVRAPQRAGARVRVPQHAAVCVLVAQPVAAARPMGPAEQPMPAAYLVSPHTFARLASCARAHVRSFSPGQLVQLLVACACVRHYDGELLEDVAGVLHTSSGASSLSSTELAQLMWAVGYLGAGVLMQWRPPVASLLHHFARGPRAMRTHSTLNTRTRTRLQAEAVLALWGVAVQQHIMLSNTSTSAAPSAPSAAAAAAPSPLSSVSSASPAISTPSPALSADRGAGHSLHAREHATPAQHSNTPKEPALLLLHALLAHASAIAPHQLRPRTPMASTAVQALRWLLHSARAEVRAAAAHCVLQSSALQALLQRKATRTLPNSTNSTNNVASTSALTDSSPTTRSTNSTYTINSTSSDTTGSSSSPKPNNKVGMASMRAELCVVARQLGLPVLSLQETEQCMLLSGLGCGGAELQQQQQQQQQQPQQQGERRMSEAGLQQQQQQQQQQQDKQVAAARRLLPFPCHGLVLLPVNAQQRQLHPQAESHRAGEHASHQQQQLHPESKSHGTGHAVHYHHHDHQHHDHHQQQQQQQHPRSRGIALVIAPPSAFASPQSPSADSVTAALTAGSQHVVTAGGVPHDSQAATHSADKQDPHFDGGVLHSSSLQWGLQRARKRVGAGTRGLSVDGKQGVIRGKGGARSGGFEPLGPLFTTCSMLGEAGWAPVVVLPARTWALVRGGRREKQRYLSQSLQRWAADS